MANFFSQFIFKLLTSVISFVYMLTGMGTGTQGAEIETPEDFTPVLRFVVCSDIHLNGDENQEAAVRFGNLFDDMYAYAEKEEYKALDAMVVAGDFTGGGAEKEYEVYTGIVADHMKDGTQLLTILGNHEFIDYRDVDATVGYDVEAMAKTSFELLLNMIKDEDSIKMDNQLSYQIIDGASL